MKSAPIRIILQWLIGLVATAGLLYVPVAFLGSYVCHSYAQRSACYAVSDAARAVSDPAARGPHDTALFYLGWVDRMTSGLASAAIFFGLIAGVSILINALILRREQKLPRWFCYAVGLAILLVATLTPRRLAAQAVASTESAIHRVEATQNQGTNQRPTADLDTAASLMGWLALEAMAFEAVAGISGMLSAILLIRVIDLKLRPTPDPAGPGCPP